MKNTTQESLRSALDISDFRKLICLNFFLTLSVLMLEVLVSYELYKVTKDPMSLGLIGLAIAIPYISVTLLGGHLADKMNKKWIMLLSMLLILVISLFFVFIFSTYGNSCLELPQKVLCIYLFFGISGLARGFYQPAASSFRPYILPRHLYANGSTWNSTAWQLGSIGGSLLAGFGYAQLGLETSLMVTSGLMVIAIFLLILIKTKSPKGITQSSEHNIYESIREGFVFVLNNKILLYSLALDLVAVYLQGWLPYFQYLHRTF